MAKASSRSKPREVVNGVKRFSAGLSDQAIIDASVGLFIIVALSMLLLRDYQRPLIQQLPVGSVAAADIIAPEDVKIEDTADKGRFVFTLPKDSKKVDEVSLEGEGDGRDK